MVGFQKHTAQTIFKTSTCVRGLAVYDFMGCEGLMRRFLPIYSDQTSGKGLPEMEICFFLELMTLWNQDFDLIYKRIDSHSGSLLQIPCLLFVIFSIR